MELHTIRFQNVKSVLLAIELVVMFTDSRWQHIVVVHYCLYHYTKTCMPYCVFIYLHFTLVLFHHIFNQIYLT